MGFFGKIKKRWYVVLIVVLILAIGGAVGSRVFHRQKVSSARLAQAQVQTVMQVGQDLLYLENFDTLKVTPKQAKDILPLMDKLRTADSAVQSDFAKQIYGTLSPSQYAGLLSKKEPDQKGGLGRGNRGKSFREEKNLRGRDQENLEEGTGFAGRNNSLQDALPNIVTKMLQDRSQEKTNIATP